MKKFIVAAIALVSMSAFADHTGRHMVTLGGYENDNVANRTLDLYNDQGSRTAQGQERTRNIALNYAYGITDAWQIGVNYKNFKATTGGDEGQANAQSYTSYGVQVIYNFAGQLIDTNYLALKYDMKKFAEKKYTGTAGNDDDKVNTWGLEFGHRFSLGTLWSMNFNWSPSIEWDIAKTDFAQSGVDNSTRSTWKLNVLKVDVVF